MHIDSVWDYKIELFIYFRELQCLYKNHIEDIRLQHTFSKLERQSFAGILEHKHKISQVSS